MQAYLRGATRILPELLGAPWLPASAIQALNRRRRMELVRRAFRDVPHYRRSFSEAGITERDLLEPRTFERLPYLTKEDLRTGDELLSRRAAPKSQLLARRSSGSTGAPVVVYFDPLRELQRRAQELRMLFSHGVRPWHRQLVLDAPAHLPPKPFLVQRLGLWRRIPYPVALSQDDALQFIAERRAEVIHGVLAGVRMLALAAEARGGLGYRPHRIFTRGEVLDAHSRWFVENALGARLVDFYATEETGIIAWECPTGAGYHVDSDLVHLEVLRADGSPAAAGEMGEVVLTNLFQHTMPIIRYRVGDMAALSARACECGRNLPLLERLHGRRLDFIVTPSKQLHDPFRVMAIFESVAAVRWFRVEQQRIDALDVFLAFDPGAGAVERKATERELRAGFASLLGSDVTLRFEEQREFSAQVGEKAPLVRGLGLSLEQLVDDGYQFRI
ncbi:MAG: hypothetical protein R3B13_19385 [Polyangiaceae bacterium]